MTVYIFSDTEKNERNIKFQFLISNGSVPCPTFFFFIFTLVLLSLHLIMILLYHTLQKSIITIKKLTLTSHFFNIKNLKKIIIQ